MCWLKGHSGTAADSGDLSRGVRLTSDPVRRSREVAELLTVNLDRLCSLPLDELDSCGKSHNEVTGASGRRYTVTTDMFWGGEPAFSTAYVFVKVRPRRGWRRLFAYKASDVLLAPASVRRLQGIALVTGRSTTLGGHSRTLA